ncbi:unnamed protein product [Protopolystoma xenopodis]|uniref:Uncharacterized protein n=1 Tax=Protopolystoma xenopodis TaxID=117903 RepID=A0A448WIN8_9PLAT|nr:unnamed protein product [Protopolystoma xenopodis]
MGRGPAIQCPLLVPLSPSQLTYTPFRLLSCHRCGLRFCLPAQPNSSSTNLNTDLSLQPITPVTRANPSSLDPLIQCSICLTWSHRSCYSGEVDKTAFRLDWACDGCAGCYSGQLLFRSKLINGEAINIYIY